MFLDSGVRVDVLGHLSGQRRRGSWESTEAFLELLQKRCGKGSGWGPKRKGRRERVRK